MTHSYTIADDSRSSFHKVLVVTALMALCFAIGLIVGQRVDPAQSLISLGAPEQSVEPIAVMDTGEEHVTTSFSFYEVLANDESPRHAQNTHVKAKQHPGTPTQKEPEAAPTPQETAAAAEPAKVAQPTSGQAAPSAVKAPAPQPPQAPKVAPSPSAGSPTGALQAKGATATAAPTNKQEDGHYTLQIGSHPSQDSAQAEISELRKQGVSPYLMTVDVPQKGRFYRVRVGRFPSLAEARRVQSQLQQEMQISSFVSPI